MGTPTHNVASLAYRLFCLLEHFLQGKMLTYITSIQSAMSAFFESKLVTFFRKGTENLLHWCMTTTENDGGYVTAYVINRFRKYVYFVSYLQKKKKNDIVFWFPLMLAVYSLQNEDSFEITCLLFSCLYNSQNQLFSFFFFFLVYYDLALHNVFIKSW